MRIESEVKLDFSDVLIRPKRSTLGSRKEVDLHRSYTFRNYDPEFPENTERHGLLFCFYWFFKGFLRFSAVLIGFT